MVDASYATAWELGRLMSINEPRISQQIAQWKTSHARELALAEQNLFFDHIPFTDSDFAHKKGGQLETNLQQYFSDLRLLKGIPFHYLIPHESLLPDESLRIFYIDPLWIECLLDGAFSIGRTTQFDQKREKEKPSDVGAPPIMTGVLLRSDLVSGWPSLLVEGYSSQNDDKDNKLNILRFDRLSPNVLLIIFEGELQTTTIHLPPESLHFGFSRPNDDEHNYFKELKDLDNDLKEIPDGSVNLTWKDNNERLRVFDVGQFIVDIKSKVEIGHSGQFAVEMLEGDG